MATFQIFKSAFNSNFYYHLRATGNNETILSGEGYTTKDNCKNAIASVKLNAPYDGRHQRAFSANRQFYFNLTATNDQIIGTSETYTTATARDHGIELVKSQAPNANIQDLT